MANAPAHPVTLHMAFISEADDGLTRQSVDALARPETVPNLPPPSEYGVAPTDARHAAATRHHRHRAPQDGAQTALADKSAPGRKSGHPWVMVKLIAFTNWWNGWSERNLHTTALDVHLDRSVHHDQKTS